MIGFKDTVRIATHSLLIRKGRSFLTILGIIIGVGAILIVMSVGDSAEGLIVEQIQSFGPENVFVNPGKNAFDAGALLTTTLTKKDLEDIKKNANVPDAVLINPSVQTFATVSYESETEQATIWGTGERGAEIYHLKTKEGRELEEADITNKTHAAVIGKNVAKDLFGADSPIGKKIKIKGDGYQVVGTFSSDVGGFFGIDDMVAIPYTTAQQYLLGIRYFHEIVVQAKSPDVVPGMVEDIKQVIRENHDIDDPEDDDFVITTQEDFINSISTILNALTTFLALVAAISLVVGGIGVMNIMYVSVTERTREIGLRKSLGATNKNVLLQFLIEAILLTGIGGVVGVVGGTILTYFLTLIGSAVAGTDFPFSFSVVGMVLGIVVSCGIGIVFGVFPARAASKKSPVEALRYE